MDIARPPIHQIAARPKAVLPIAEMVVGLEANDVADLLPRVFNLCRAAQSLAARAAMGLPLATHAAEDLRRDILRDHVVKVCLKWPPALGLAPIALPQGWLDDLSQMREVLFGPQRAMPRTAQAFWAFISEAEGGLGPVLGAVKAAFDPHVACTQVLPLARPETVMARFPQENTVAARHARHPVMKAIAQDYGRGPLWRATAIALDMESCVNETLPAWTKRPDEVVVVPAARGLYAIEVRVEQGRIKRFRRVTPTDHLLVSGGVLDQSLASLDRPVDHPLMTLLLDILDPCIPLELREVGYA
ncbi:MAG: hydrogenase expression/formation protein HupK [Pelagimonas sp.]|uniref:hydrogenase expression/formation protein HupK n=1 Tax=Pelagimonas sp. TaxID=2073170 RepID=UPI003D6B8B91